MSSVEITSLVVTIICLLSFCVVFTILFKNYYAHQIAHIKEGKDDIELIDNALYEEQKGRSSTRKVVSLVGKVVSWSLLGVIVVGFSFALYSRFSNNVMMLGNNAYIVIASGSMEERNSANTYLDTYDLNNQINTYDMIEICKYNSQSEIKPYDVVAFKNKNNVTIVHRIIEIRPDGTYVTRGDSNNVSDTNTQYDGYLKYENIIGRYTGNSIPLIGLFVIFLQSNSGIITIVSIIYCMFMFDHFRSKYEQAINERTDMLISLTNYDMAKEEVDDVTVSFNESLYYKGDKYNFKDGIFVKKENSSEIISPPYKEAEETNTTVKIKTKVLKVNKLDSKNDNK